jgi:hypothetical protein
MDYRGKGEEEIFEADGESQALQSSNLAEITRNSVAPEIEVALSNEPLEILESFKQFQRTGRKLDQWSIADKNEIRKGLESPWEKFLRLQSELRNLQQDLSVMSSVEQNGKASLWAYLQSETERVLRESGELEGNPVWETLKDTGSGQTEGAILAELIGKVQSLSTTPSSAVVPPAQPSVPREIIALEERLHRLESLVGHQSNLVDLQASVYPESIVHHASIGSSVPLFKVAQHLEERIALLDSKTLDTIKAKAKLLRSDLEALTAGNTASSTATTTAASTVAAAGKAAAAANEIKIFEAAKKIETFSERVKQVESIAEDLPIIVARMKTLENVHWNATTAMNRLEELETQAKDVDAILQSNQDVLAAMKHGLEENLKAFQQGVQHVEARFAALK